MKEKKLVDLIQLKVQRKLKNEIHELLGRKPTISIVGGMPKNLYNIEM